MTASSLDLTTRIFASQATIVQARATREELTKLAQGRAPDPAVFDDHPPFFWANEISSNRVDAYFTIMDPDTTLRNFAAAAARGVAFLIGHDHRAMPFGSTLTGTLETTGDLTRVLADAYTLQEPETEAFIRRVRAGIQQDDSVGFYGGQWICAICGRDMLTDWWECWHVPGLTYEQKDATGNTTTVREVLCTALVRNADLAEVSAVYDGATPGAVILFAEQAAEAGRITPQQQRLIESRYRIHLPDRRLTVAVPTPPETPAMDPTQSTPPADDTRASAPDTPPPAPASELVEVRALVDRVVPEAERATLAAGVRWLIAERERLAPLADDGATYRKDLIEQALAEGVRAVGSSFAVETYRALLDSSSIPVIKRILTDWQAVGDARFPGGRTSTDAGDPPPSDTPANEDRTPLGAYKVA